MPAPRPEHRPGSGPAPPPVPPPVPPPASMHTLAPVPAPVPLPVTVPVPSAVAAAAMRDWRGCCSGSGAGRVSCSPLSTASCFFSHFLFLLLQVVVPSKEWLSSSIFVLY